jgi:hypothetical protein
LFSSVQLSRSPVCWRLSHRLDWGTSRKLAGRARGEYVKMLCGRKVAPGVLAYSDAEVAGWAAAVLRSQLPFARSAKSPTPTPCTPSCIQSRKAW